MKKTILILTDINTQKEIEQLVNFKELGYDICESAHDLNSASSYIMNHNVDIVICNESDIQYIKNNNIKLLLFNMNYLPLILYTIKKTKFCLYIPLFLIY